MIRVRVIVPVKVDVEVELAVEFKIPVEFKVPATPSPPPAVERRRVLAAPWAVYRLAREYEDGKGEPEQLVSSEGGSDEMSEAEARAGAAAMNSRFGAEGYRYEARPLGARGTALAPGGSPAGANGPGEPARHPGAHGENEAGDGAGSGGSGEPGPSRG